MNEYYFNKEEAMYLGNMELPSSSTTQQTLSQSLRRLLVEKATAGATELCTSHDLAPLMFEAFDLKRGFHQSKSFKATKIKWIKARSKVQKKMKNR